jgi:hypothetical protein
MRLGLVFVYRNKRVQDYRCRVPSNGWVQGNFEPFIALHDIWDCDKKLKLKLEILNNLYNLLETIHGQHT